MAIDRLRLPDIAREAAVHLHWLATQACRSGAWLYCRPEHPADGVQWTHDGAAPRISLGEYRDAFVVPALAKLRPVLRWVDAPLSPERGWEASCSFMGWQVGIATSFDVYNDYVHVRLGIGRLRRTP